MGILIRVTTSAIIVAALAAPSTGEPSVASTQDVVCFNCSNGLAAWCESDEHGDSKFWPNTNYTAPVTRHTTCVNGFCAFQHTAYNQQQFGSLDRIDAAIAAGNAELIVAELRSQDRIKINEERGAIQVFSQSGLVAHHLPIPQSLIQELVIGLAAP